jgi:AmmeMemoRadiSam system protein A
LAQAVADSDPRFHRVTPQELDGIDLEISVLTREREIQSVEEIEIGRHGLIVEQDRSRGLLLPQVPTEHGWDRDTFLDHTCLKAGLAADAWRRGARIFVFEAQVFGERE